MNNTNCKNCGNPIASDAQKCPYCGTSYIVPQGNTQPLENINPDDPLRTGITPTPQNNTNNNKKKLMTIIAATLVVVFVTLLIIKLMPKNNGGKAQTTTTTSKQPVFQSLPTTEKTTTTSSESVYVPNEDETNEEN